MSSDDCTVLAVFRNRHLADTDPMYLPVLEFVEQHGLVLFSTHAREGTDIIKAGGVALIYAEPDMARGALMGDPVSKANFADALADLGWTR